MARSKEIGRLLCSVFLHSLFLPGMGNISYRALWFMYSRVKIYILQECSNSRKINRKVVKNNSE